MESSNFQPPVRRALTNSELEARVNQATSLHQGVESVMELLVAQEALRAQEEAEITAWIAAMVSNGSPEALLAVENFRRSEQGLAPLEVPTEPESDREPISAATAVEPEVQLTQPEPQSVQEQFPWLNPTPPKISIESLPVQEITPEPVSPLEAEKQDAQPVQEPFTWFTQTQVEDLTGDEQIVTPEPQPSVEVEVEIQKEEEVLVPVGTESEDDFETLLAAAAAEEELTALEEKQSGPLTQPAESNVLIPSDEHRNRGFGSQILVWLGLSATITPILLVFAMVMSGLSAPAISIVLSVGYLISGSLIALATIAGKRSGQSTGIISRAIYGVWGNSIPNTVMFISRVFIVALIIGTFSYLMNGVEVRIPDFNNQIASAFGIQFTVGLVVQLSLLVAVTVLALFGGNTARTVQVLLSLLAFGLVFESFFAVSGNSISFVTSGTTGLFTMTALSGAALIVLVNLTIWFAIAPNLAKAIPANVRGYKVFMAALVSNFVAPVAVGTIAIVWLGQVSLLAPQGFSIQEAVLGLPKWAQGSLVSGVALAIVYAAMLSIRSAALDIVAIFRVKAKIPAIALTSGLVALILVLFAQQPAIQQVEYLVNLFVLVGALSAGWIGIFAADVLERKIAYHELSLARAYGVYKKFNVLSLLIWLVTLVCAVAVIPVNLYGFGFMGFALPAIGLEPTIWSAALGFAATGLVGFLLTAPIRTAQIRKQEAEIIELEARREQLKDIFVSAE